MTDLIPIGLTALSLALTIPRATKEKYYVLRNSSIEGGVILLVNGIISSFYSTQIWQLYYASIAIAIIGLLAILGTSQRQDYGTTLGSGKLNLVLLVILTILQLKYLGIISLF